MEIANLLTLKSVSGCSFIFGGQRGPEEYWTNVNLPNSKSIVVCLSLSWKKKWWKGWDWSQMHGVLLRIKNIETFAKHWHPFHIIKYVNLVGNQNFLNPNCSSRDKNICTWKILSYSNFPFWCWNLMFLNHMVTLGL